MAVNTSSIHFNGTNQAILLDKRMSIRSTTDEDTSAFSILAWIKVGENQTSANSRLYVERQGTVTSPAADQTYDAGIRLSIVPWRSSKGDRLRFEFSAKDGRRDTNYDYTLPSGGWGNGWRHVGFVGRLGQNPTFETYLDGVMVATGTLVVPSGVTALPETDPMPYSTPIIGSGADSHIYLGNHSMHSYNGQEQFATTTYYHGAIDDLLVFKSAVSGGDITAYVGRRSRWDSSDTALFSEWRFNEGGTSTTTADSDNAGWTGTLIQTSSPTSASATDALWSTKKARSNDRPWLGEGTNMVQGPVDTTGPAGASFPSGLANGYYRPLDAYVTHGDNTSGLRKDGKVYVTINTVSDNIYATKYVIEVSTASNFTSAPVTLHTIEEPTIEDGATTRTTLIEGLLPTQTYYFRYRAFDAALNAGAYSSVASFTTATTEDLVAPPAPEITGVSSLTYSSFTVSFDEGVPSGLETSDEVGFAVDVALDSNFNVYHAVPATNPVQYYRNRDIGSAHSFSVVGTKALTNYYIRVRSRDAEGNFSISSDTFVVATPPQPDTVAPNTVDLLPASAVSSRGFTANWEEGVDNVAVVRYYIDVSTDSEFATFFVTPTRTLQNINTGNVLSFRVDDLLPATNYWYRVRAQDDAGNISPNTTEPQLVETLPSSLDEGGSLTLTTAPTRDTYTSSAAPNTVFGTATTLNVAGNGSANTQRTYIYVDIQEIQGRLTDLSMRLYCTVKGTGALTAQVAELAINESTVVWNAQPEVGGGTVTFTPLATGWVDVPLGSLITGSEKLILIEITMTGNSLYTFVSREGLEEQRPEIIIESDPSTATRTENISFVTERDGLLTNYIKNPSFENGTMNFWNRVGSPLPSWAISTAAAYNGLNTLTITGTGAVGQGIEYSKTDIPAVAGDLFSFSIAVRAVNSPQEWRIAARHYDAGGVLLGGVVYSNFRPQVGNWQRVYMDFDVNQTGTAYITFGVETRLTTAASLEVDAAIVMKNHRTYPPMYFDGNTSSGYWDNTANASRSFFRGVDIDFTSSYLGDSNDNNTAIFQFKPHTEPDWIEHPTPDTILSRTLRRATSTVPSSFSLYNQIPNPQFKFTTSGWNVHGTGPTFTRSDEITDGTDYSLAVTVPTTLGVGVMSDPIALVYASQDQARARVWVPQGLTLAMYIRYYDESNLALGGTTTQSSQVIGNNGWNTLSITKSIRPSGSVKARVTFETHAATQTGLTYYVSKVQLQFNSTATLNPYRDGDYPDARWEGNAHSSPTNLFLQEASVYDLKHIYTDVDGVVFGISATEVAEVDTITTPRVAENTTTFLSFTASSVTGQEINFVGTYDGDDNTDMTVTIAYKRFDFTNYTDIPAVYDRVNKQFKGTIPNVQESTKYTLRATVTDPDGVYGTNPRYIDVTTVSEYPAAEPTSTISFDGFLLMGRDDGKIGVHDHDAFGLPNRRLETLEYLREHGGVELSDFWGTREINMNGFVSGQTRAELQHNLEILKRALAPQNKRLIIDTLPQYGRHYQATCTTFAVTETGGENYRHLVWDATFTCVDPFAYSSATTVIPTFSAVHGTTIVVTNGGDIAVYPKLTIKTTHTQPVTLSVQNLTTGERIIPKGIIRNGSELVIDNGRKALYKNGVEMEYAGGFFLLAAGSNTLKFEVTADQVSGQSATLSVDIEWRERFL